METIYLDNGSTSFPKAPGVGKAMADYIEHTGVNVARGGYEAAYAAAEAVLETREHLCRVFGAKMPENVVFTSGVTASLNMLLKGFLQPGDTVVTTSMEHNAVMRPLQQLKAAGVAVNVIACLPDGTLPPDRIEKALRCAPKAMVMTAASNVCGTLLPVREAATLCQQSGTRLIVDAAQTGGSECISMDWGIDALAFSGHKGLLGPQGIGGFLMAPDMVPLVTPIMAGGTGSISHSPEMPDFMPDRFEAGTANLPGIFGLRAALSYLLETGQDTLRRIKTQRTAQLLEGLSAIDGIRVAGLPGMEGRTGVISVDFLRQDNARAAFLLESQFGILTRCGLHCAPEAHKTLGTYPQGTVRFAPGYTTTAEQIEKAIDAVRQIAG